MSFETKLNTLCWTCEKCTDKNACEWSEFCSKFVGNKLLKADKILKHLPKGAEIDKKGNIKFCPKYERDNLIWTIEDYAKLLNISIEEAKRIINRQKTKIRELKKKKII